MADKAGPLVLAFLLAGFASAGCNHAQGPSLSASVETLRLSPSSADGNAATVLPACCCRVVGTVRNTSSIPVNVSLRFPATDARGKNLGVAVDYVQNLAAGSSGAYDAAGILAACSQVVESRLRSDLQIEVLGVYRP